MITLDAYLQSVGIVPGLEICEKVDKKLEVVAEEIYHPLDCMPGLQHFYSTMHELGAALHFESQMIERTKKTVPYILPQIPDSGRVLDTGCGMGYKTAFYAMHTDAHFVGIDVNEAQLAFARSLHTDVEFVCDDYRTHTGSYDYIICDHVLHESHLGRENNFDSDFTGKIAHLSGLAPAMTIVLDPHSPAEIEWLIGQASDAVGFDMSCEHEVYEKFGRLQDMLIFDLEKK